MKLTLVATVFVMLLISGTVFGNHAFAKKYLPGELPNNASKDVDVKKKSIDEIRALAEQAKKDALDKFQKDNPTKQSKHKQSDEKQKAMDAAKAELKKKTDAALSALKTKNK